jgi:hypothetical protein
VLKKNVVKDAKTQSGEDLKNRTGKALKWGRPDQRGFSGVQSFGVEQLQFYLVLANGR